MVSGAVEGQIGFFVLRLWVNQFKNGNPSKGGETHSDNNESDVM